jgi:hypothetical protein
MRPETIAAGWHSGKPFYCGKTVNSATTRLRRHRQEARKWPDRASLQRVAQCGEHLRILTMEIVAPTGDWAARERHWIAFLRHSFGALNVADGGAGVPGAICSEKKRAKLRSANLGKKHSVATRAKMSDERKQRKLSPAHRDKLIAGSITFHKGKIYSPERRAALKTRLSDPETRAKMSDSASRRRASPETKAKMREAQTRRRQREASQA